MKLDPAKCLPADHHDAVLIGRIWQPTVGPTVVRVTAQAVQDLTGLAPTVSQLLDRPDPARAVRTFAGPVLADLGTVIANSVATARDPSKPRLLAPCDLQALKAAGVTFVASMLERVIEERAKGDPSRAEEVRRTITGAIGDNLRAVKPGSEAAAKVKTILIAAGMWSPYLEVGIGPDAEIFTKAQPMSAVGLGADIGILASSAWSNPEPEIVLAVNARGEIAGATLGNDVNLRDIEGRSALLLGKAKDNNASAAIGPFIRLFDEQFTLDDVRRAELAVTVVGTEGFEMSGQSSMTLISRDPADLVAQAMGRNHQYPDGMMLYLGTMFAPIQDRSGPGQGFTHRVGDIVTISSTRLGALINRVDHCDAITPWTFGAGALMRNLSERGLLTSPGQPTA